VGSVSSRVWASAAPCLLPATLAAEFTPKRRGALVVIATIVTFPLGGVLAGLFAAAVIPECGWRGLFLMAASPFRRVRVRCRCRRLARRLPLRRRGEPVDPAHRRRGAGERTAQGAAGRAARAGTARSQDRRARGASRPFGPTDPE